jgi:hypothetical protein
VANGVTNLNGFEDFISDAMGEIEEDAQQIMVKIGIDLWRSIVLKTPVDTGRARASWNMQWGSPDGSVPSDGAHDTPRTPSISGQAGMGKLHISSNLNYIQFLEEGSPGPGSDQAPQGMVQVSLQELTSQLG